MFSIFVILLSDHLISFQLYVRAISDFGSTPITIHISVSDQNDPPEFVNAPYSVSVKENALVGTELVQLSATDSDSGAFGQVTFISEGTTCSR